VTGFVHSVRASMQGVAYGEKTVLALGTPLLEEKLLLGGRALTLRHSPRTFFQVNTRAAELLYNTAQNLALEFASVSGSLGSCWDVYCGVGGLALVLAGHSSSVLGLESVPEAIALARKNATETPHCRFETADAAHLGEYFRRYGSPHLLAADPPRTGLAPEAVKAVLRGKPKHLLLVSCDAATLARDMALLAPAYRIHAVQPVDLFPQTPHAETVSLLTLLS
jgi:23S rRNA (uracil1939-C5)-methyltransferase